MRRLLAALLLTSACAVAAPALAASPAPPAVHFRDAPGIHVVSVHRLDTRQYAVRVLSPASIELMDTNVIPKDVLVKSNGTTGIRFNEAVGFGLDFQVDKDPRAAGSLEGKNTMSWGGAAGTWFWIDPTNDMFMVGMIQRLGGTGGDDLGAQARTLTYQALVHPER